MKKLFVLLTAALILSLPSGYAFAKAAPTPTNAQTPTQSITQIDQQINNLKDKIASKVAQLKLVEKRGIIGTVTDASDTQITIKDMDGNQHFIDVDELTKFDSSGQKNFGISDVTKNMKLGILGLYNKESRRILARFVTVQVLPTYIHGAIADMDKKNYTVTVAQDDGIQATIEIEDITKTTSYDSTGAPTKSGFSKLQVGERIYVAGYPDKQDAKQLIASRILVFPSLAINPAIGSLQITPEDTLTPTPSLTPAPTKKVLK